jgi:hypothetical protein
MLYMGYGGNTLSIVADKQVTLEAFVSSPSALR